MASIVKDARRGTWSIQWFNGVRWTRTVVLRKRPGWTVKMGLPKKVPAEVQAALTVFAKKEEAARRRKGYQPDRPIAEFLETFLEGYEIGRTPASKKEAAKAVGVFLEWCEGEKLVTLDAVDRTACHRWMAHRARTKAIKSGRPLQHATLKKERALLATAWSEGLKQGIVAENPWPTVEVPGKPVHKKRGSWKPEEYEKLLAVCKPWLRDFLIVGCHTGLRAEALRGIEWRDIRHARDGEEGFGKLVIRPELDKTGKGYEVPIHPAAHDVFMRRFVHNKAAHDKILTGMRGGPIVGSNHTDEAITVACKRAGLTKPDSPNHHMRRTFGRWAVFGHLTGQPVPMYLVSRWLGHSSLAMTQRYLDIDEADSTAWMLGKGKEASPSMGSR